MLRRIDSKTMGKSNHLHWLKSTFHFSFADYYNPDNVNFGVLRVINDDRVQPHTGFDTHPHRDMEIISYVIDGNLTHKDSMGNEHTLQRGEVQYMSAGTGITHSEHNLGNDILHFLQIWILPDSKNHTPNYGDYRFNWEDRINKWLYMVSGPKGNAPIKIHQDINISSLFLEEGKEINFEVKKGRQAYCVLIEGKSLINNINMFSADGMEIIEENISIKASEQSHCLLLEMEKQ